MRYLFSIIILSFVFATSGCVKKNYYQPTGLVSEISETNVMATAGRHYKKNFFHNLVWGKHYRHIWALPVEMPVFNLNSFKEKLVPVELGGGQQTTSLTFSTNSGKLYTIRTLDKDPTGILPKIWAKSFVANVFRDQTSAINPYGAFIVADMLEAGGIYHSNPTYFYVKDDDTFLGEYSDEFRGKVVMFEEKFKGKADLIPAFGPAVNIVDSEDLLFDRYEDGNHIIDQKAFAKARLFDIMVGDWDRHEGQWQWVQYQKGPLYVYKPIPKDRDQVFYKFEDGMIPWFFSRRFAVRKLRSFKENYTDIKGITSNARFIDERALSELEAADWQQIATTLKSEITDDVIDKAVAKFPEPMQPLEGDRIKRNLKNRRDDLPMAAEKFYKTLAKEVTVAGSDKKEKFIVNRLSDTETEVTVWLIPDGEKEDEIQVYNRTFKNKDTEKIMLHGLGSKDVFKVEGIVKKGIKIEIIGGLGEDEMEDISKVNGLCRKTIVKDTRTGNNIKPGKETKVKTTRDVSVHAYDREGF